MIVWVGVDLFHLCLSLSVLVSQVSVSVDFKITFAISMNLLVYECFHLQTR